MSRPPLFLSAVAIVCVSTFVAVTDQKGAIANAVLRSDGAVSHKWTAREQERAYGLDRHYRGYEERPSAMIASSHPA